ncbi:hypothetical protein V8C34DRAFT_290226 [Trichoderma compactum]
MYAVHCAFQLWDIAQRCHLGSVTFSFLFFFINLLLEVCNFLGGWFIYFIFFIAGVRLVKRSKH